MTDLGLIPGQTFSTARAINEWGQIVGESGTENGPLHAFVFNYGKMRDLGSLGSRFASVTGINNRGQMIGRCYSSDAGQKAFCWQVASTRTISPVDGSFYTITGINNFGQFIGTINLGVGDNLIFHGLLSDAGHITDFGHVAVYAINNKTQIVGTQSIGADTKTRVFVWDKGGFSYLPSLSALTPVPASINDQGQIVGSGELLENSGGEVKWIEHALLWENGQCIDLNTAILPGSDYILDGAIHINNKGQIVCFGIAGGLRHGFLLTPAK